MMTIHRDPHHSDFTCVSNKLIKDKRISLAAKGFMLIVLSLGDNWQFSINGLSTICGVGKGTVYKYIAELESAGYAKKYQEKNDRGQFHDLSLYFYEMALTNIDNERSDGDFENIINDNSEKPSTEEPFTEEPSTEEPFTEEPSTEKPSTEEPSTEEPPTEEPPTEIPHTVKPSTENHTQYNINQYNKNNNIISSSSSSTSSETEHPEEDVDEEKQNDSGIKPNEPLLNKPPKKCYEDVCLQINADKLRVELGREITDMAVDIMFNCLKAIPVSIGGRIVDGNMVYKAFAALDEDDVRAVILAMQERGDSVRNPRSYLQTLLYNRGAELAEKYAREQEEEQKKASKWLSSIDMDEVTKDILRKYYGY